MKISKKIREKILKDNTFSLKMALLCEMRQTSVQQLARRNSDKLCHIHLVEFYKQEGFTDEEIFEKNEQKRTNKNK